MELALVIAVQALMTAIVGIIYPFSLIGRRRSAVFTLTLCLVVIGLIAWEQRSGGTGLTKMASKAYLLCSGISGC